MTKTYDTQEKKPSRMFVESLPGGGASCLFCYCGRTHYAPGNVADSDDPDDYQRYLDSALDEQKTDPAGIVINYEDDFVRGKDIDGKTFVVDCPCNGLRRYENWMWSHRAVFRDYLMRRTEQEAKWAVQENVFNKIAGIK